LVIFVLIAVGVAALSFLATLNPTCFDGKQNQKEESIDCGGPCDACVGTTNDLIVVWSKPFKFENGKYEAVSLVKNPNLFAGIPSLKYKFKLYDKDNILIAVREGKTFINPGESYVIFETGIDTGERIPKRAFMELEKNLNWERIEKEVAQLVVSRKKFSNEPFSRLNAEISNKSIFSVSGITAVAILYDDNGNAIAASSSVLDSIAGSSSGQIVFTWAEKFGKEPKSSKIFLRTNLTRND